MQKRLEIGSHVFIIESKEDAEMQLPKKEPVHSRFHRPPYYHDH